MNKLIIGAVGISLLISATGWFSYRAGVNSEIAAGSKIIAKYQDKQRKIVRELEKAKHTREVVYRDKIKIINKTIDVCADIDASPAILQQFKTRRSP